MTLIELEEIVKRLYGFVYYDKKARLYQVMIDDVILWLTHEQIEEFDEMELSSHVAKMIITELKSGNYPKEIYLN